MADRARSTLSSLLDDGLFLDRLGTSIPGLVYVYDLLERRNVYTNRAMAEQLGYSPEQVGAMGDQLLGTIIHPDDLPPALEHHRRMSEMPDARIGEIEYRVRAASGEFCWLHSWETILSRNPEGQPRLLLGIAQDVTGRVRTEEALRDSERRLGQSEQRWRSIVENPFDFVVVIDRKYRYTFVNSVAPGLREEDLVGKATPFDFVAPEFHEAMGAAFRQVFEKGLAASYDVYVPMLDKWYSSLVGPIREGDAITHASILTRDITSEKLMQAQARRAEQRLRLATEGAREVLFDRELETGEAFVAPRIYDLLGFAPGEVTIDVFGPGFAEWLHPEDRGAVLAAHRATVDSGVPFAVGVDPPRAHEYFVVVKRLVERDETFHGGRAVFV